MVGSPDGLAVVRVREDMEEEYPTGWLFAMLRSEPVRLQFWTESGGTSYGKLDLRQIGRVRIPIGMLGARRKVADRVELWIESAMSYANAWAGVGSSEDRRPILNSPMIGLFEEK